MYTSSHAQTNEGESYLVTDTLRDSSNGGHLGHVGVAGFSLGGLSYLFAQYVMFSVTAGTDIPRWLLHASAGWSQDTWNERLGADLMLTAQGEEFIEAVFTISHSGLHEPQRAVTEATTSRN